jgi:hypothetical protein
MSWVPLALVSPVLILIALIAVEVIAPWCGL